MGLNYKQSVSAAAIATLIFCFVGCERATSVAVNGKNPPTFKFSGTGEIQRIVLFPVTAEGKVPPKGAELWVLHADGRTKASECPPVTYGVVPDGFTQEVPTKGSPPSLQESKIYAFGAITTEARGGDVWFTIRDGSTVAVPKTDPADF